MRGLRSPPKNRMTLRADGFKPTHDGMDIDGKKISPNKYFRIYRFPEFRIPGNIHPNGDSCTFMDIELKIRHDRSLTPQIFKR